jgi:hypothetical protein
VGIITKHSTGSPKISALDYRTPKTSTRHQSTPNKAHPNKISKTNAHDLSPALLFSNVSIIHEAGDYSQVVERQFAASK